MSAKHPLNVVIMWHMHQPHYRNAQTKEYELPWTYLHAIKDYVDMANLIEAEPDAHLVVNFAPVLLEQIDDYSQQIQAFLDKGETITDPLLFALASENIPADRQQRHAIVNACLRANEERLVKRFPAFNHLTKMARWVVKDEARLDYFTEGFFSDLLVWYHLAWFAETVRRNNEFIQSLQEKARDFSYEDRRQLLQLIGDAIASVIPKYKMLAERKQIELTCSPYMHPIIPLLIDLKSAHEAMPHAPLPESPVYPGGEERARWHIQKGFEVFERYFGFKPRGVWPSEGSVSEAAIELFADYGVEWVASGESVMRNSVGQSPALQHKIHEESLHHGFHLNGSPVNMYFRDDGLSDLIGFTYSTWHADDAVSNLIHHLENIADACADKNESVVSIILDGENAWEYYPENGYYFLSTLYKRLAEHPQLNFCTFSDIVDAGSKTETLDSLVAGSWVYGTFSTWIGDADKNRGWDLLCEAKREFDKQVANHKLSGEQLEAALQQLAICEGSDWFWWFGDYNPAESVKDFERLYRTHLVALYELMGVEPPAHLQHVISVGGGQPSAGGVMRQGKEG